MTTLDLRAKKILGQQRNVQRYCRLLATDLTDLERRYLHKRIPEGHAALDRLAMETNAFANPLPAPDVPPRTSRSSS